MKKRILVADDEILVRQLVRAALEGPALAVDEAADGVAALGLFDEGAYDLVISDMRMPRLDGLGLLAAVRRRSPEQPFMLISAAFDRPPQPRDGVVFMGKPFELDEFVDRVEDLLESAPAVGVFH